MEIITKTEKNKLQEPEQIALSFKECYIGIQTCTEGYDYSIFDVDYNLLDGGVYDDLNISINEALKNILEDVGIKDLDEGISLDYDVLMEKGEEIERIKMKERRIVLNFKAKTKELFNHIEGHTSDDIERIAHEYIKSKIKEYYIKVDIIDVLVSGSRSRGLERKDSDIDIVVEYKGNEREDFLYNIFNEDEFSVLGIRMDINPITKEKTGTLAEYLPDVEKYLAEKHYSNL